MSSTLAIERSLNLGRSGQLTGIGAVGVYTFFAALIFWLLIKYTVGIRVSLQEEIEGLDIGEHGNSAYPDFVIRKPHYTVLGLGSPVEEKTPEYAGKR